MRHCWRWTHRCRSFGRLSGLSYDEVLKRVNAGGEVGMLLKPVLHSGWGGVQLYHRLTPGDLAALQAGQLVTFRPDDKKPGRRLPEELDPSPSLWWPTVLTADASGQFPGTSIEDNGHMIPVPDLPGARLDEVRLKLNRTELGTLSLSFFHFGGLRPPWRRRGSPSAGDGRKRLYR